MKVLQADGGKKLIFIKLRIFYKKCRITIKYAALYMHKENKFAKGKSKTIIKMKDAILIDNGFLHNFWAKAIETANYLQNRLLIKSKSYRKLILKES